MKKKLEEFYIGDNEDGMYLRMLCKRIGLKSWEDLQTFLRNEREPGEDVLDTLLRYEDELGDEYKGPLNDSLQENKVKDIDIDIQTAGGKEKWLTKAIDDLNAKRKEYHVLTNHAARDLKKGSNFESKEEIEEAKKTLYKEIRNLEDQINIVKQKLG